MRVEVLQLSSHGLPAGAARTLPRSVVAISGGYRQLDDPRALVRKAITTLKNGKARGASRSVIAKKVFGLLYAASLRAKAIEQLPVSRPYDPRQDYLELRALARERLGPPRPADHMISQVRSTIDDVLRIYSEPTP